MTCLLLWLLLNAVFRTGSGCNFGYEDWDENSDFCYRMNVKQAKTYQEATADCTEDGGKVIEIYDSAQNELVANRFKLMTKDLPNPPDGLYLGIVRQEGNDCKTHFT